MKFFVHFLHFGAFNVVPEGRKSSKFKHATFSDFFFLNKNAKYSEKKELPFPFKVRKAKEKILGMYAATNGNCSSAFSF